MILQQRSRLFLSGVSAACLLLCAIAAVLPTHARGEGMFAVEGKSVTPIPQVDSEVKKDRVNTIKRVLTPIPIVAAKQNIVIPGPKAKLRFNAQNLEFYLREAPPDGESSTIERSHRPGTSGPE